MGLLMIGQVLMVVSTGFLIAVGIRTLPADGTLGGLILLSGIAQMAAVIVTMIGLRRETKPLPPGGPPTLLLLVGLATPAIPIAPPVGSIQTAPIGGAEREPEPLGTAISLMVLAALNFVVGILVLTGTPQAATLPAIVLTTISIVIAGATASIQMLK